MATFQPLTGFRDFYPAECAARDHIFNVWRETCRRFGFVAYDGPPLETLELYTTKSGEEIVHQLYNFVDKGERHIALRPEMTPTFARMAGSRHREFKKPIKWFSIPQLFRYERPQKGRLREHYQWNVDIVGEADLGAEVEAISLLLSSLTQMGLTSKDVVVRLSDRIFWSDFLKARNVPESEWYEFFQALDKMERADEIETRKKLGRLADDVYNVFNHPTSSERLDRLTRQLSSMGWADFIQVDLKIIRGLAYYTGTVFEVHDRSGAFRAIAGGGRYDHLLKLISGNDLPAFGFGMGDLVLAELLKEKNLLPSYQPKIDYFIVIGDESHRDNALRLASSLRNHGHSVDYPLAEMKFNKQLEMGSDRGAAYALIVDDKFKESKLGLRNLTDRSQSEISFSYNDQTFSFSPTLPL